MYARVFKDAFKYSVSIANDKEKPLIVSRISTAYVCRQELSKVIPFIRGLHIIPSSACTPSRLLRTHDISLPRDRRLIREQTGADVYFVVS